MAITREEVEHIAELAKLYLTEEEKEKMQRQLSAILDYFAMLQEIDTSLIPPTATVLPLRNVMREDTPAPSFDRDKILANAPQKVEGYVKVKVVLE
jgi:aspartyl-tRNA(Asn)/glutamyl-tRNA(Gln) amidotransferase subunit C